MYYSAADSWLFRPGSTWLVLIWKVAMHCILGVFVGSRAALSIVMVVVAVWRWLGNALYRWSTILVHSTNHSNKCSGNHPRSNWPLSMALGLCESWWLGYSTGTTGVRTCVNSKSSVIRAYRHSGHTQYILIPARNWTIQLIVMISFRTSTKKSRKWHAPWLW